MKTGRKLLISLLSIIGLQANAQDRPIGYWRSHLPYNTAVSAAFDGITMYVASEQAFYTYNIATGELAPYSKVEGMADVGMSYVGYDALTRTAILAYKNSNIDLFKDGSFYNMPDLKLKTTSSTKNINHIYTHDGLAYLSTDVGIVVIDLDKQEVKETYSFSRNGVNIPILRLAMATDTLYAVTNKGLYKAPKNGVNLQDFSRWQIMDTNRYFNGITRFDNKIFVSTPDTVFAVNNNLLTGIYTDADSSFIGLDSATGGIWVRESFPATFSGAVEQIDANGQLIDSVSVTGVPKIVIGTEAGSIWFADAYYGMATKEPNRPKVYMPRPEGPQSYSNYDVWARNKEVLVAHGAYDQFYTFQNSGDGFARFKDEKWVSYRLYDYPPLGTNSYDFIRVTEGPDGSIYAGSTQSGLFILHPDGSYEHLKADNSPLDEAISAAGKVRIHGIAFDEQGNLWVNVFTGRNELAVRTKEGIWYEYNVPFPRSPIPNGSANIIIDRNNLKWYSAPGGGGLIVYDDNGTLDNPSDDRYRQLLTGQGTGNLPDNEVYCIAEDKNGAIWFGTGNGIGIINCPADVIERQCEGELRVVQYDNFAGYLFQNENVRALAVDGANRKWVGTNNGVWLISADGNSIVSRFTAENSPLPSNLIQKITIDEVTGDVYIGTEQGLVSYRGTAVEGDAQNSDITVFPNPVVSGYQGPIAIKGLVENADVRITDVSGQLVYRTRAFGGQAVWNGMDYTGRRPQSGVYMVFVTNRDGSQTNVGKLVFME